MLSQVVRWSIAGGMLIMLAGSLEPARLLAQAPAAHNTLVYRVAEKTSQLSLMEKESRLFEMAARIKTVDGFDPSVVKITTVDNFHQVRVVAMAPGFTSVILVDEHGHSFTVEILVSGDVRQLEAVIRKAAPGSSVQAMKVKDNILLLGWVDQPQEATKIVELAEQFHPKVLNYLQVSGVQTIMLRVKMMEAQRSKIRSLGFNFLQLREHSYVGSLPGPITPFSNRNPIVNIANPLGAFAGPVSSAVDPTAATAVFGLVSGDNAFQGFIEALKTENLLTILAEPTLITTNGRPASFLSGGQFPVPVPQGLGTVSVVYKPFGVQLEFVPTVMGSGRLRMQVKPEVSEKDLSNTLLVSGITVPSLTTRSVNTEVEMNFGETLVIAGLISNRVQATTQKVPFLGELPWIGAAFRRVRHDDSETELLVLVTPELAAPTDESRLPDGPGRSTVAPTDRELFFNGYLETPRYAPDPENTECYDTTPSYIPAPASHMPPPRGSGELVPQEMTAPRSGGTIAPLPEPPAAATATETVAPPTPAETEPEPAPQPSARVAPKRGNIRQVSGAASVPAASSKMQPNKAPAKSSGPRKSAPLQTKPGMGPNSRPGLIAP